jgi:uncharacterized membrane protein
VIALLGLGHGVLNPTAGKMRDRARADLADGSGRLSAEYEALARREMVFGIASSVLVLVALFLMVVKPGA